MDLTSCRTPILNIFRKKSLTIDIEGNIYKLLQSYRIQAVKIVALIVSAVMAYIIRSIPYHPVTIIGSTIYSRISAACLSQYNVPYVLCRGSNYVTYYETDGGNEIAFEGKGVMSTTKINIPPIPLSQDELKNVRHHTGLDNLTIIQNNVLKHLRSIENIFSKEKPIKGPIMMVKPLFKDIYYVVGVNECWLTRIIITDKVFSLRPGDRMLGISTTTVNNNSVTRSIEYNPTSCIIHEPNVTKILTRSSKYTVDTDFRIYSTDLIFDADDKDLPLYSLMNPRPIRSPEHKGIYVIHPFHIPATWNPLLSIMLITLGLISK